jgi:hypothetical protein
VIELIPLCHLDLEIGRAVRLGATPSGQRTVGLADGGRFDGDRLAGRVKGLAADWFIEGADGVGMIDARALLETDDGALIHMSYLGRTNTTMGMLGPFYTAPLFETASPAYVWLNHILSVARGVIEGRLLRYEIYEVR